MRANTGDIGRRVAERRMRLGLTREETAARAAMAVNYLRYVEEQPADSDMGGLLRLAGALETTVSELLGGGADLPPGTGTTGAMLDAGRYDAGRYDAGRYDAGRYDAGRYGG